MVLGAATIESLNIGPKCWPISNNPTPASFAACAKRIIKQRHSEKAKKMKYVGLHRKYPRRVWEYKFQNALLEFRNSLARNFWKLIASYKKKYPWMRSLACRNRSYLDKK